MRRIIKLLSLQRKIKIAGDGMNAEPPRQV